MNNTKFKDFPFFATEVDVTDDSSSIIEETIISHNEDGKVVASDLCTDEQREVFTRLKAKGLFDRFEDDSVTEA